MKSVLITDDVHPVLIEGLKGLSYHCDYRPDITLQQTADIVSGYEGLIINSKIKADRPFLDLAMNLQFIGRLGSGLDIIDLKAAQEKEIAVLSAPEGNANAVAEHAMGMLLCLLNNIHIADAEVRDFIWNREANRGIELEGRKVGIIGYGHTGPAFAKKLSGFGVEILVYDRFKSYLETGDEHIRQCPMEVIQEEAEILSIHVSLNPSSKHMINSAFIEQCANPFYLVNTSRGNVIKTEDLIAGLVNGKILGACLDVYENEKPGTYTDEEKKLYSLLYQQANVILTPHVAGWTIESKRRIAEVLIAKIADLKN